jgi:hypothetical protein
MGFESNKTMFEIYRETAYTGEFKVVYFTELQEHNKETEINRAMAGQHLFDGFLKDYQKDEAKAIIERLLNRMNSGEALGADDISIALANHLA